MKHGADIYRYAKKAKCKPDEITDFSSNINFVKAKKDFSIKYKDIVRYADSSYTKLKKTIAKRYGIKKSHIKLYNGATAGIYELIASLKEKKLYLYVPLYGEYESASRCASKKIYKINRFEDINKKVSKNSIVVFVNPSTPDGRYYDMKKLFAMWKKQKCSIIVDESFIEFEEKKSLRDEIKNYKKLYIIQSFSKFYGSGGVRIGCVFSNKKNIAKLNSVLWNISSLDVSFLKKRLLDGEFYKHTKQMHLIQKENLFKILKKSKLFDEILPSDANYILTRTKDGKKLFRHLLKHKILCRVCGSFDYLGDDYIRFAVKGKKSHKKLKKSLVKFCYKE